MFEEFFKGFTSESQLERRYKELAYFFIHECGWSQEDFDEAEVDFMSDILEQADKVAKKRKNKK